MNPRRSGIQWAMATAAISGLAIYVNSFGVLAWKTAGGSAVYTTAKNLIAAAILLIVFWRMKPNERPPEVAPATRHRVGLGVVALIGGALPFLLFFEGLTRATSTQAGFLHKTLVIWVALLAVPLLRERLRWPHIVAIGLLIGGQAIVQGGLTDLSMGSGEMLVLVATWLWAIEVIVNKRLLKVFNPRTVGVARMAGGGVLLIMYGIASGQAVLWSALGPAQIGWVILTGVLLSAYVLTWLTALSRAGAVDVTAVLVGGAIVTAVLSGSIGAAGVPSLLGLVLVALGVALVSVARPTKALAST